MCELELVARRVCDALGVNGGDELVAAAAVGPVPVEVAQRAREALRASIEADLALQRFVGRRRAIEQAGAARVPRERELGPGSVRRVSDDALRVQRRERLR